MTMTRDKTSSEKPPVRVHVVGSGARARKGWLRCQIGGNVKFSTKSLESYFFTGWDSLAYEALLVAAAVEFADISKRRPALTWQREFMLRIPVQNPDQWNSNSVSAALTDALAFLSGDVWRFEFYRHTQAWEQPQQARFTLPSEVDAVIPFSNGLDSRAVAGLVENEKGRRLVRVRLGTRVQEREALSNERYPFTSVPYKVGSDSESSGRTRGFKFAVVSAVAARLARADEVIVPESGQGALGPVLVSVGQGYPDYRSHPLFTARIEKFLHALFGTNIRYTFPQIWSTKAETLRKFIDTCKDSHAWSATWSCWQQNRHSSVDGKRRHCGICAACMLRRLSVHAAGCSEPEDRYVWENLKATSFWQGAALGFDRKKMTPAMREYAIAGTLHLDHLAGLRDSRINAGTLHLNAFQLSKVLAISESECRTKMDRLLQQHRDEWKNYVSYLGENSFIADWAVSARS